LSVQKIGNEHLGERWFLTEHARMPVFAAVTRRAFRHRLGPLLSAARLPSQHPSAKKSFAPRIATTASLLCSEMTVIFALLF